MTAGYITDEARPEFYSVMDAANVDLKAFTEHFYEKVTLSHLQPVLDTLKWLKHKSDVWFEITNLVIPEENDSDEEFTRMCDWILENLGDSVPIHFTAFHPDFKLMHRPATPPSTLLRARKIAKSAGIKFVYTGNVDDIKHQSTYCPSCDELLIERNWYELGKFKIKDGKCQKCKIEIPGLFENERGNWGRRRLPLSFGGPSK